MELVKDYDCNITYHLGKANVVVADALSRKTAIVAAHLTAQVQLQVEMQRFELAVCARGETHKLYTLTVQSTLRDSIRDGQSYDEQLQNWRLEDESMGLKLYSVVDGIVRYRDRLWVPSGDSLKDDILNEAHSTPYSNHLGSTKMYKDLQIFYWWPDMKRDIVRFVSECLTCQQVKVEHQRPAEMLKSLPIPECK